MTSMSVNSGHCLSSPLEECSAYLEDEDDDGGIVREYRSGVSGLERSEEEYEESHSLEKRLADDLQCGSKKRRKQSNPVKVFAGENKAEASDSSTIIDRRTELRCPYCSQVFYDEETFSCHIKMHHVKAIFSGDANLERNSYYDAPLNLSHQKVKSLNNDQSSSGTVSDSEETLNNGNSQQCSTDKSPSGSILPFPPPSFLLPFLTQAVTQDSLDTATGSQESGMKIFNPEAYCELCNKEFCNKYFLKTHKANKHGVYSDLPSIGPMMGIPSSYGSDNAPLTQVQSSSSSLNNSSPSGDSHDSGRPSSESDRYLTSNHALCCNVCQKEFGDVLSLSQHRANEHSSLRSEQMFNANDESLNLTKNANFDNPEPEKSSVGIDSNGGDCLHNNSYRAEKISTEQVLATESSSHCEINTEKDNGSLSEHINSVSSPTKDQMNQMGVINPDAFCTICCKEFCNKYFLKVHKYRRHSIGSPPADKGNSLSQADGSISCLPLERLLEAPLKESNILDCDSCGRAFQSKYLLQMHKYYFHNSRHNIPTIPNNAFPPGEHQKVSSEENGTSREHISQDLQKLQGMISGLKDKKDGGYECHVCGRNAENPYLLQVHILKEHGMFANIAEKQNFLAANMANNNQSLKNTENSAPTENNNTSIQPMETVCIICKKECYAPFFLQQHLMNVHGLQNQPLSETAFLARIRHEVENQKKPERPKPASTSRSYCEICNKELCNKYFMKTHMIKMHGINMDNHQVQGVKCDICQKEICSTYFLKVHKQNTHGIYDPEDDRVLQESGIPKDEEGLEICTVCSGKFKTAKLLECHMQSEHGAMKEKKSKSSSHPANQPTSAHTATCNICGMTLPGFLALRLHVIQSHPLQEHKQDDNARAKEDSTGKMLLNPFGSLSSSFSPFMRPERMMSLLPRVGSSPIFEQSDRVSTSSKYSDLDLQQNLLAQQLNFSQSAPAPKLKDADSARRLSSESKETISKVSGVETAIKRTSTHKRYFCCRICRRRFLHRVAFLYHWHEKHIMHSFKEARSVGGFYKKHYRCRNCSFSSRRRLTMRKHIYRRHHRSAPMPRVVATPIVASNSIGDSFQMQSFIISMSDSPMSSDAALVPAHVTLPVHSRLTQKTQLSIHLLPA